jgi:ATP-dependent DNA helicase RecQ
MAVSGPEHEPRLLERLRERAAGPTIIYVTLQRSAEELAARLREEGFPARAYHAGLEDDVRGKVQDWFMNSTGGIVVATIAFGMGIDKADIRYVYHTTRPRAWRIIRKKSAAQGVTGSLRSAKCCSAATI